jgi:hypothetical protein
VAGPDPRRLAAAFLLAAGIGSAIVVASWAGDPKHRTAYGDGLLYRFVAAHLAAGPAEVARADPDRVILERGPSLRYGRIGLPAAIWVASGGDPDLIPVAQPAVLVAAAGAAGAATAALFPGAGPLGALLPFLAPGFSLSLAGGYAEVLAVALGLWAVWLVVRGRPWPAALLLGAAILAKENAAFVLAGLALWLALRRRWREVAVLAAGLVPVAAWWGAVAARFGHPPPLDPYLREATTTVGAPVAALVQSLVEPSSTRSLVMLLAHLVAAGVAVALLRTSLFGLLAVVASVQLLAVGPFGWRYVGDAARVSSLLEVLVALAVACWLRPAWTTPGTVPAVSEGPALASVRGGAPVPRPLRPG